MACSFNAAFFNYPMVCSGSHFFGISFSGYGTPAPFYNGTIKSGVITYANLGVTQVSVGPSLFTLPFGAPTGTYIVQLNECNNLGTVICAFPPVTVNVINYNLLPYEPGIGTSVINDCQGMVMTAILTGPGTIIPSPFNYFELYNGVILVQSSGPVPGNVYTFGLEPTPGTFHIKVFRPQPPGNPNAGQQSPCYYGFIHTHVVPAVCFLKAIDCNDSSIFVVINAPILSGAIGQVIYAALGIYTERCWILEETNPPFNAILNGYTGPFADCPTCTPCSDITSTITGVDESCNRKNGSVIVTPINGTAPYSYSWTGTSQTTQTITGLTAGVYTVIITDANGCTGTNSIVLNNIPCNSYLITPCDPDITPFVVQNPITSPDPNPNNYVGNIFSGIVAPGGTEGIEGCYNMTTSALPGVTGFQITVTAYSFNTCIECAPVAYKITRCDDPNIFYFTNSDLSAAVGYTINGVILTGCDDTTFPCDGLLTQCWTVSTIPPFISPVIVTYDSLLYPDCDCCKPC